MVDKLSALAINVCSSAVIDSNLWHYFCQSFSVLIDFSAIYGFISIVIIRI